MRGNSLIRPFLLRRPSSSSPTLRSISSSSCRQLNETPSLLTSPIDLKSSAVNSTFISSAKTHFSSPSLQLHRTLCSSLGPSNIVLVKKDEEFENALKTIQEKKTPAIFYFTAAWCGPCRLISPVIQELSEKYPHVTTYKIDIDEKDLQTTLSKLAVSAVPTLFFLKNGEKVDDIVGADLMRLKDNMEKFYGQDNAS